MTVAVKNNPKLWETSKKMACKQAGLCKHSARKMQWATRYYKSKGGTYASPKSSKNSLTKWGKEKWRTYNNQKSKGKLRYLPSKAWEHLSPEQIRRTNNEKRRGYNKGKQFVSNPKDVANIAKNFRSPYGKSPRRKSPRRNSPRRKSSRRKSSRRKSPRRKSPRRKSPRRKSPRRKSPKRKSPKRKSPPRRNYSPKTTYKKRY